LGKLNLKLLHYLSLLVSVIFILSGGSGVTNAGTTAAFAHGTDTISAESRVTCQYIGEYSIDRLNEILTKEAQAFTPPFHVEFPRPANAVKLYRIKYSTVIPEQQNRQVTASGLIALPDVQAKVLPVVSFQHGTVFNRTSVPSNPDDPYSTETRLMIARFAGMGYMVIAADNIGKGVSTEPDNYMVKESTAQACLDMLYAAQKVCPEHNVAMGDLFLSGWSQGALSTVIFLNKLESLGIPVRASVSVCTPNDLYAMFARFTNVHTDLDVQWTIGVVCLMICSYEEYYDMKGLSAIAIKPEYLQAARDLYSNKKGWGDVAGSLPATTKELLQEDFAAEADLGENSFCRQLKENVAYRWRFKTPTRFYWGQIDEVITPYINTLPVEYQHTIGGATSQAVFAGEKANHRGTFLYSVLDQKIWFDELLQQ
jgi:pimeloyl-ACP methyl ester carboxylesterase